MAKIRYLALAFLILAATLFEFIGNDGTIESLDPVIEIAITLSGDRDDSMVFNHPPTIKEVLDRAGLENVYNFDMTTVLQNNHDLYLDSSSGLVSLNEAGIDELQTIKGIGPVTAMKIVAYRNSKRFETIEEIMEVSGIGEKTYLKLRGFLCL
ncbi:MAG: helix-hairpin-helix domain-containing protein [Erysipelotrichaceae bacterium]|nr:helix-hairpin-helix domain-containing protein [Erysipelotrichaceae bacterium]MDD3809610.1 helix-hairpin-helix domain-containing protein [Erysipelotrichaceae bacterium]